MKNLIINTKNFLLEKLNEPSSYVAISSVVYFFLNKNYGWTDRDATDFFIVTVLGGYLTYLKEHKKVQK